jgi:hypothetical protein
MQMSMTPRQKQGIMAITADADGNFYYNDALDGIWGPKSQAAAERFIRDFTGEEAAPAPETSDDFWNDIEFFKREEFRCKCGGLCCKGFPAEPDEKMVRYADEIRRRLGVPLNVNSGLRCKVWNQKNNGATASKHMTGHACDLGAPEGITTEKMASVAEEVIGNTGGLGIYPWGIHIDSRSVKARWNG